MKLNSLYLRNFKGLKELLIDFKGKNTSISGENGVGKTTVFDAFMWLLFDKDSNNSSNFNIKTLDANGQVIHGLEHEVKANIVLEDGRRVELQKIYKEKWTKKKGQADKQLTGHTTNYFIDEVPVKKSEYTEKINSLVDENIFKLVTNPLYFNEKLSWKDRRDILMQVIGDIDDSVIIDSNKKLKELKKLLDGKDIDKFKSMIASRRKKLNDELKTIPVRIDELNNSIEETDDKEIDSIESDIKTLTKNIKELENQILDHSKIYEKNSNVKADIYKKKDRLRVIEQEQQSKAHEPKQRLQQGIFGFTNQLNELKYNIQSKKDQIDRNKSEIENLEKQKEDLRAKWYEENSKTFEFNDEECNCPTCGQNLPENDIETKKADMEENFYKRKQEALDAITSGGKKFAERINILESENEKLQKEIKQFEDEQVEFETTIAEYKKKYESLNISEFVKTDEYKQIKEEITLLQSSIVEPDKSAINELKDQKQEMIYKVDKLKYSIRAKEQNEKAKNRIKELQEKERHLANKIAELEGQEFLCEEFVRTKVDLLESKINSKFKTVRFKLFNTLVNGALEETCETLIDGVPFQDANNAAKINAGIDIINTLSEYFNVQAPIFVDNAESVNKLIPCKSQVIRLVVTKDEELKVEVN